jgi:predicted translin family RNA/ssDNA-binding protein
MTDVIGIRVSKKLKEELKKFNVEYANEVKTFLERILKQKKLLKFLEEADSYREEIQEKYGVMPSSADFIRWDRDHGHT